MRVVGKTGTGAVVLADQKLDLGAAEDHSLGSSFDQPIDDLDVGLARGVADHAEAQLLVDDGVHDGAIVGLGRDHREPV